MMQDAIAIQSLKTDIALLRQHIYPPQYLQHVEGLPIYYGLKEEVEEGVTGPTRMQVQKHFDKEKGLLRARINATEKALKISDMKVG